MTLNLPKELLDRLGGSASWTSMPRTAPWSEKIFLERVAGKEGLLPSITDAVDAGPWRAPGLRMIANFGVGFNNIDVAAATARASPCPTRRGADGCHGGCGVSLILAVNLRVVEGDRMVGKEGSVSWRRSLSRSEVSARPWGSWGWDASGQACRGVPGDSVCRFSTTTGTRLDSAER